MSRRSTPLGVRQTLALVFLISFLIGSISVWKVHTGYLGGTGSRGYAETNDASLAGAWLPILPGEANADRSLADDELPSIRGGKGSGKRRGKGSKIALQSTQKIALQTGEGAQDVSPTPKHRVHCMVPFIWTPSALHAYHAIEATWGKRCDVLQFFIDPVIGDEAVGFHNMTEPSGVRSAKNANLTLPDDVIILYGMRRPWHTCRSKENENTDKPAGNCRNIFEKVWRMIVHVASEGADWADWFVKVDSDTYLFPDHVGRYVESKGWSPTDPHYFGHVLNHRQNDRGVSIVAGGAVFYSRAALLAAADAFQKMPMDRGDKEEDGTCRDAYTGTEEVVTAVCLKEHSNITAEPAIDEEGREQVSLYEVPTILDYNRTHHGEWWFWEGKHKYPCHDDGDCLTDLPLAFHHYKDSKMFFDFEKEFYGSVMTGERDATNVKRVDGRVAARNWPNFDRTQRYFERVRAAMKVVAKEHISEQPGPKSSPAKKEQPELTGAREQSTTAEANANGKRRPPKNRRPTMEDQTTTTQQNRVYCAVPFIWMPSAIPTYHAIRVTWGKRCHILRFFIDPVIGDNEVGFHNMTEASGVISAREANLTLPEDVVVLHGMRRPWHTCGSKENEEKDKPVGTCRNIFEKVWRMLVYVVFGTGGASVGHNRISSKDELETDAYKAEWFVKVDADTFLFPDNVGPYVESREWSYNDHHYFGHVLNHRQNDRGVSIVAGGAVFYSRAALLAAADAFQKMPMDKGDEEDDGTCRDAYTGTEEVPTAVCLKEHSSIIAEPTVDEEGREEISLYEVDDILNYNRTDQGEWWFWEGKKRYPCHDSGDCLAHFPLAFHHYKDPQLLHDLEKEFYGSIVTGAEDESLVKKNDGRVASRHWPNFNRVHRYFEHIRAAMKAKKKTPVQPAVVPQKRQLQQLHRTPKHDNRLYCMVPFIWSPDYQPVYRAIRKTWGQRCDVLKFTVDPIVGNNETGFLDLRTSDGTKHKLPEDVVVIDDMKRPWNVCPEDPQDDGPVQNCRNIWEKVWRSWVWVDENGGANQAEWFVKIDADSYLFPDNLKHYVTEKGWSPDEHHYFGHVLNHRAHDNYPIVAGAAVFFSRETLKAAASIFRKFAPLKGSKGVTERYNGIDSWKRMKCVDAFTDLEEVVTSVCLKEQLGVDADPVLDEMGQELVTIGEVEDVLLWNRTEQGEWWYWSGKPWRHPKTGKDMHQCCGDLPIAFHGYKDPQWFYMLENEFHSAVTSGDGDGWKGYEWRNLEDAKRYFDRVRRAMKASNVTG
ncbi:hypothetical protein ACHAXT_002266 [Thalassiosira profunda]